MENVDRSRGARSVAKLSGGDVSFVTRHIAGETIIVPVCDRVADLDAIYTLNEVGSRIWDLIEGPTPVGRIARRISEEYDVSEDRAAEDVAELLTELEGAGLVCFTSTEAEG